MCLLPLIVVFPVEHRHLFDVTLAAVSNDKPNDSIDSSGRTCGVGPNRAAAAPVPADSTQVRTVNVEVKPYDKHVRTVNTQTKLFS